MPKQKRLWEGAFIYGEFLLFHDYVKGDDGRPRYKDWVLFSIQGNEDLGYLKRPQGEILGRATSMRALKNVAQTIK